MIIKYRGHKTRTAKATKQWFEIATDYNNGVSISDILSKYKKQNNKPYTRVYVYWVLKRVQSL